MAWPVVHSVSLDNLAFHKTAGESSSALCGCEEALPSRDGSAPFPMPSHGCFPPLPHPKPWRRRPLPNGSYGEKARGLLAQGSKVVYELLHLHPDCHPGHQGLPHPPEPAPSIQTPPGEPLSSMLPPRDQPRCCPSSPISTDPLPPPSCPISQDAPGKKSG